MADQHPTPETELPAHGRAYRERLPAAIPAGHFLVHNSVRPARRGGWRGSRYWLQDHAFGFERCPCGWTSELGAHYRVTRPGGGMP